MINVWAASDSTHQPVRNSMAPSAARPTSNRRVSEHSPSDERVTLDVPIRDLAERVLAVLASGTAEGVDGPLHISGSATRIH